MTDDRDIIGAAKAGDVEGVRRLLTRDPGLAAARADSGETPVLAALYRGHTAIVDLLIASGTPLDVFSASATGRTAVLASLLRVGGGAANGFAFDGWTPLHLAAFFGHPDAVELLLDAGADVHAISRNSLKNTPLHAAIAGNHAEAALLLLARGAPVEVADAGGHTPLHIAAEIGSIPVVRALLERGADPFAVDAEDRTPLARAASRNHHAVVELMNS